jgi:hypothetical protein
VQRGALNVDGCAAAVAMSYYMGCSVKYVVVKYFVVVVVDFSR